MERYRKFLLLAVCAFVALSATPSSGEMLSVGRCVFAHPAEATTDWKPGVDLNTGSSAASLAAGVCS